MLSSTVKLRCFRHNYDVGGAIKFVGLDVIANSHDPLQSWPLRHRVHKHLKKLCTLRRSFERHDSSEGTVDERFFFIEPIPRKVSVSSLDVNRCFDKNFSFRFSCWRKVQFFWEE